MGIQTEAQFVLPRGFIDEQGDVHRDGTMRLATAGDEILPMRDPRVQANPAYLTVILLSRVITRLGDMPSITPKVIEGLFSVDLAYLQDFYRRFNEQGTGAIVTACPKCEHRFNVEPYTLVGA